VDSPVNYDAAMKTTSGAINSMEKKINTTI
jgi:hypothetical protein